MKPCLIAAAIAMAFMGTLLTVQTLRLATATTERAKAVADLSTERANATAKALRTSQTYRQLEGEHRAQIDQISTQAATRITAAVADAGHARATRDSLRTELADYITAHRQAAKSRAATGNRTPDTTATDLLADLQRRADDRAGELAEIADTARIRGEACERAYDSAHAMSQAGSDKEGE